MRIYKVYTKTGDKGETGVVNGHDAEAVWELGARDRWELDR